MNTGTRITTLTALAVSLLASAGANAQLLGGAASGAMGGTLAGQMGGLEASAIGGGALSGAGRFDAPDRLRDRVTSTSGSISERSQRVVGKSGDEARETVDSTRSRVTRTGAEVTHIATSHQAQDLVPASAAGSAATEAKGSIDGKSSTPALAAPETAPLPKADLAEPTLATESSAVGDAGPAKFDAEAEGEASRRGANASAKGSVQAAR